MASKELNLLETAGQDFNVVESMILENPKIILLKDSVSINIFINPTKRNKKINLSTPEQSNVNPLGSTSRKRPII